MGRPKLDKNLGTCHGRPIHCRGMCKPCYSRDRYETVERNRRGHSKMFRRKPGDTVLTSEGYVLEYIGIAKSPRTRGWKPQHRLVMEKKLNRTLESFENVHHKNAVKHDNRPKNLELWISAQPKGARVEDLVEYAEWILGRYKNSTH